MGKLIKNEKYKPVITRGKYKARPAPKKKTKKSAPVKKAPKKKGGLEAVGEVLTNMGKGAKPLTAGTRARRAVQSKNKGVKPAGRRRR